MTDYFKLAKELSEKQITMKVETVDSVIKQIKELRAELNYHEQIALEEGAVKCPICGKVRYDIDSYMGYHSDAEYCSDKCRNKGDEKILAQRETKLSLENYYDHER